MAAVPTARLHATAAEANSRRAWQNRSVVALLHAEAILRLAGADAGALASNHRFLEQVRRAEQEDLASDEEQAGGKRRRSRAPLTAEEREERQRRREHKALQKGREAYVSFRAHCIGMFGNMVRAWRACDRDQDMSLDETEFTEACKRIGFEGNVKMLWGYLDRDGIGTCTLLELDPQSADDLARFKMWAERRFAVGVKNWLPRLDTDGNANLTKAEFAEECPKRGYRHTLEPLFQMIDVENDHHITAADLRFLDSWNPPEYLLREPDHATLRTLRTRLREKYGGSYLRAWREALDRDHSMSISWNEFRRACVEHLLPALTTRQVAKLDLAAVWRAMDEDLSGCISLRELDPASYQALRAFKDWAIEMHGSCVKAIMTLNEDGRGGVDWEELERAAAQGCTADLRLIFDGLDGDSSGMIAVSEVRFLDYWDPTFDEVQDVTKETSSRALRTLVPPEAYVSSSSSLSDSLLATGEAAHEEEVGPTGATPSATGTERGAEGQDEGTLIV